MTDAPRLRHVVTAEEIPPPLRPFYAPAADGTFMLSVDEHPKLDEFRTNNRALHGEKTALEAKLAEAEAKRAELETKLAAFANIDPVEHLRLAARVQELEAATADAATLKSAVAEVSTQLAAERLRNAVGLEFLRLGGRPEALAFAVDAASKQFAVTKDGDIVARDPAASPSLREWAAGLTVESSYLFAPSKGGDAGGSSRGPASQVKKIISNDPLELGRHLEGVANGTVVVGR